eukprot:GHVU01222901.1.p1 GENE.GHVU01222901.1~~GHVU01222901.1.p1  ORF type:complete len:168 (-),score=2.26 GHVU01222901.1:2792-3295(-)
MMRFTTVLGFVGLVASAYAVYVERNAGKEEFNPFCNFGEGRNCLTALTSEYAHMLRHFGIVSAGSLWDVSNAMAGLVYYGIILGYPLRSARPFRRNVYLVLSLFGLATSLYYGWILYFVLKDLCVVCITTYVVNVLITLGFYLEKPTKPTPTRRNASGSSTRIKKVL